MKDEILIYYVSPSNKGSYKVHSMHVNIKRRHHHLYQHQAQAEAHEKNISRLENRLKHCDKQERKAIRRKITKNKHQVKIIKKKHPEDFV